jgi:hypothetical protein
MATALKPLLIFIDGLENLRLPDGNIDIDWIPAVGNLQKYKCFVLSQYQSTDAEESVVVQNHAL